MSTCEEDNPIETRSDNLLPPLLRMCGSQLQSICAVKSKELEKLEKRETLSSADINRIKQELKFVDYLSMNEEQKRAFARSLPSTDRGRMRFPIPEIHTFLSLIDRIVSKSINIDEFRKHGKRLFQVSKMKVKYIQQFSLTYLTL